MSSRREGGCFSYICFAGLPKSLDFNQACWMVLAVSMPCANHPDGCFYFVSLVGQQYNTDTTDRSGLSRESRLWIGFGQSQNSFSKKAQNLLPNSSPWSHTRNKACYTYNLLLLIRAFSCKNHRVPKHLQTICVVGLFPLWLALTNWSVTFGNAVNQQKWYKRNPSLLWPPPTGWAHHWSPKHSKSIDERQQLWKWRYLYLRVCFSENRMDTEVKLKWLMLTVLQHNYYLNVLIHRTQDYPYFKKILRMWLAFCMQKIYWEKLTL